MKSPIRNILLLTLGVALVGAPGTSAQLPPLPGIAPAQPPPEEPPPEACPTVTVEGEGAFVGMVADQLFADPLPEARRCTLNKMADAGVRIIRQSVHWKSIEVTRGTYDYGYWDDYVEAVARHGIQLMPIIQEAPTWRYAPGYRSSWAAIPPRPAEMASFAARLVRRYGPDGRFWSEHPDVPAVPIRVWQIWNEPNLPRYWAGKPNARAYVKMLRYSSRAIKREDPGAEIVTAGMPDSTLKRVVPLYQFIHEMYAAGAAEHFDTLAVNGYAETTKRMRTNLTKVRSLMTRNRDTAPIWITELGWGTGGPQYRFRTTKKRQAVLLRSSFQMLRKQRRTLGIRGIVHYMWQDTLPWAGGPDFWGIHTGLLDLAGNEKPAFPVFRKVARQLRWTL